MDGGRIRALSGGVGRSKDREIKVWPVGAEPRTLWKDHDARSGPCRSRRRTPSCRPTVSRWYSRATCTGWTHLYVTPITAESESQARQLTSGNYTASVRQLVSRQPPHRVSPMCGREPHASVSSRMVDVASEKSEPIVTRARWHLEPSFSPDGASRSCIQRTRQSSIHSTCTPWKRRHAGKIEQTDRLDADGAAG